MNDMTTLMFKSCRASAQPDMLAEARAGRIRALAAKAARRQAAFQPIEVICANVEFQARVAAIVARRGGTLVCARPVAATMPLAAG